MVEPLGLRAHPACGFLPDREQLASEAPLLAQQAVLNDGYATSQCARKLPCMQPENLEARVSALEVQVRDLAGQVRASKHDAAAARVLAGAADRDVTEIRGELRDFRRATIGSFNALRQDMTGGFQRVDERFARVDEQFAEMRAKFDMTAAGQQRIVELIQTVIDAQGGNGPGV